MRICFIPGALDTISGEYLPHFLHMKENIRALRKNCDITVLTAEKANTHYVRFQRSRLYKMLNLKYIHAVRKSLNFLFFLLVYSEIKGKINRHQSDVFLVRYSLSNYFIARYLHWADYKILLEVHGLAYEEEREYGQSPMPSSYYAMIGCLEKRMLGWAHEISTGSEFSKNSLITIGIDEARIHVVPNAVALDKFNYVTHPDEIVKKYNLVGKIVIGFVGSFARYHGLDILLDIAQDLSSKHGNITFLLVGRNVHGSDSTQEEVSVRGLSDLFTLTGEVPHYNVPLLIAAMDIAIIPDSNTYGSPMKLFEYMAMRKAIVAPNVPPIAEIIKDGETGILFERGNLSGAIEAIERLIENEELRHDLGQRAHTEVIRSYTWDKRAEKILEIAENMLT